jgi:hypothetical protein
LVFLKLQGISGTAGQISASKERIFCMELVAVVKIIAYGVVE